MTPGQVNITLMSEQFNIHEAKARLSELIQRALDGDEVVIARRNKPLVKLAVVPEARHTRRLGWMRGRIHLAEDFDETPEDFTSYT